MTTIYLSSEQSTLVANAKEPVAIVSCEGKHICWVPETLPKVDANAGFTPEEIAEAMRDAESDGPWYTTAEVLEHLKSLDPK